MINPYLVFWFGVAVLAVGTLIAWLDSRSDRPSRLRPSASRRH